MEFVGKWMVVSVIYCFLDRTDKSWLGRRDSRHPGGKKSEIHSAGSIVSCLSEKRGRSHVNENGNADGFCVCDTGGYSRVYSGRAFPGKI